MRAEPCRTAESVTPAGSGSRVGLKKASDDPSRFTDSGFDTLCTGDQIQDEQGGVTPSCTGTVNRHPGGTGTA